MKILNVNSSPHINTPMTTTRIMLCVCLSLLPAGIASVIIFGWRALLVIVVSVLSCVFFEYISRKIMRRYNSISDCSAIVTGLLLAFSYPASLPLWIVLIGSFVAIVIVKQMFGGLGNNFVNPAIAARVTLFVSFPVQMTNWEVTPGGLEAITTATPLSAPEVKYSLTDMFLGLHGGSIGETCIIALLIGGVYLIVRGIISPFIPVSYIGIVALGLLISGEDVLYHVMAGGVILGAFYMATDYVTSPVSPLGKLIFGAGCAVLTLVFRAGANMPGGVSYAILVMNMLVPLIDRMTKPKPFGYVMAGKPCQTKESAETGARK